MNERYVGDAPDKLIDPEYDRLLAMWLLCAGAGGFSPNGKAPMMSECLSMIKRQTCAMPFHHDTTV